MLVGEGSVTTLWGWALVSTRAWAARRSSTGVCARLLPAKPRASARRVSMVMRTISRETGRETGRDGAGAFAGGGAAASRSPARAASAVKLHVRIAGGLQQARKVIRPAAGAEAPAA